MSIWDTTILGENEAAKIASGGTPSRTQPDYFGGTIRWVKSGDLNDGRIRITDESITHLGLERSAAKIFPKNTVLIALYGATVGRTGLLEIDAATNQAVCAIQPNPKVFSPFYLQYSLMHRRPQLLSERYGGAQPNISQTIIRNLALPKPPLIEQQKIAAILWKIQQAIELQEKLIATTKELKQAAMRQLFSKGLHGEKQKETEIGAVPESWNVMPLGTVATMKNGVNFSRGERGSGILTIDVLNMFGKTTSVDCSKLYRISKSLSPDFLLEDRDILFVRSSLKQEGVGWSALFRSIDEPVTFCGFLIRCRLSIPELSPEFLIYYLRLPSTRSYLVSLSGKVAITNISQSVLQNLPVPMPHLNEQQEIAEKLQKIDQKISVHERKHDTLHDLFQSLLNQLMTGQIRVTDLKIDVSGIS